jgi:hypothetical protein
MYSSPFYQSPILPKSCLLPNDILLNLFLPKSGSIQNGILPKSFPPDQRLKRKVKLVYFDLRLTAKIYFGQVASLTCTSFLTTLFEATFSTGTTKSFSVAKSRIVQYRNCLIWIPVFTWRPRYKALITTHSWHALILATNLDTENNIPTYLKIMPTHIHTDASVPENNKFRSFQKRNFTQCTKCSSLNLPLTAPTAQAKIFGQNPADNSTN